MNEKSYEVWYNDTLIDFVVASDREEALEQVLDNIRENIKFNEVRE